MAVSSRRKVQIIGEAAIAASRAVFATAGMVTAAGIWAGSGTCFGRKRLKSEKVASAPGKASDSQEHEHSQMKA